MALKDTLFDFLSSHSGELFSGEFLASHFNVTRAAIWKSINQLKNDGFMIEAIAGKGYTFSNENDTLNKELIYSYAGNNTFPLMLFDTIDSTNSYARKLVLNQFENGTCIIANTQTNGRGRRGHTFYSPSGTGLYFTYILKPDHKLEELLKITLAAAVAVCDTIRECTDKVPQIKWVNDVYIGKQKVCGILTEATTDFETQHVDSVIIGIGMNIKTTVFPEEITDTAGSIFPSVSRNQVAGTLFKHLTKWIAHMDEPTMMQAYRSDSFLLQKEISYTANNVTYTGTVIDIDDDGHLIVQNKNQDTVTLASGEVSILSWD